MKVLFRSISVLVCVALMVPAVAVAEPQTEPDALPAPAAGEQAVAALGADLAVVAQRNDIPVAELRQRLADESVYVDRSGRPLVKDTELPQATSAGSAAAAAQVASGPYPNSQTFRLHSKPGSQRVIYLDFNGASVSGIAWNSMMGLPGATYDGFDIDGSLGTWSQDEHNVIQSVFQRVAEDFAPFDVDVTTQDPGTAAIERTSSSDMRYGTVALISSSDIASSVLCDNKCGGMAYVGCFNEVGNRGHQPAWVFGHMEQNNAKYIAEAVSHEVGHNLGLFHDGTYSDQYYKGAPAGRPSWAPATSSR